MKCIGIGICNMTAGDFVVFLSIHKPTYSLDIVASIDILAMSVEKSISVLPVDFDIKLFFREFTSKRFEFSEDVDGVDFDIHFKMNGSDTEIVGAGVGDYKICCRLPRGPCPLEFWSGEDFDPHFQCRITMNKGYTLAHHAAEMLQVHLMSLARPICNPLVKCSRGYTATETLEQQFKHGNVRFDVRRLLASMRRDQHFMHQYIHRDALLLISGVVSRPKKKKTKTKRMEFISPFWRLPDDVCRLILSYV